MPTFLDSNGAKQLVAEVKALVDRDYKTSAEVTEDVNRLKDEVADHNSAIEDLEALTNRKAGMLVDTASGAIASFVPDSTINHLLGLEVAVEPVQDLHGQASPWPAGGGKNKLDSSFCLNRTVKGIKSVVNADGSITLTGTSGGTARYWSSSDTLGLVLPVGTYTLSEHLRLEISGGRTYSGTFSLLEETTFQNVQIVGFSNGETVNVTLYPQLEAGSTATAYSPYSNICPISGWDAVEVERTGINVWDEEWEVGAISTSTGQNTSSTTRIRSKNYIPVDPEKTFWFVSAGYNAEALFYDKYKNFISKRSPDMQTAGGLLNQPSNCYFVRFTMHSVYGTTYNHDISINYPSTDHAYHSFAGNTYAIQLGQTVYGGTLDAVNGTMTVTWAKIVYNGSETWYPFGTQGYYISRFDMLKTTRYNGILKSDILPTYQSNYGSDFLAAQYGIAGWDNLSAPNQNYIYVKCGEVSATDQTVIKAWLQENPLTVVYKLATPITITLDPVTIATIAGQTNNVWSDVGDVSVEYAADIKSYVDRLNQPTEDDMIANTLIAANKYFTVNNRLFLSTASIAVGAQIIPGHNCTETNLAAALNALNA